MADVSLEVLYGSRKDCKSCGDTQASALHPLCAMLLSNFSIRLRSKYCQIEVLGIPKMKLTGRLIVNKNLARFDDVVPTA